MKTLICPITGKQISGTDCFTTVQIVDGELKESALPNEIKQFRQYRDTCLLCKYHMDEEKIPKLKDKPLKLDGTAEEATIMMKEFFGLRPGQSFQDLDVDE